MSLDAPQEARYRQLVARYERIIEISQQLSSTLDHKALLRRIIAAAIELTDTEAASLLLIDPSTGELRFEMASNMNPSAIDEIVVPLEGSIAGWVVLHGEARVIQDVNREPSFFKEVDEAIQFETRNILAVPLRAHNKVIGALEAVNKRDARFNDEDIKILTTLAGQAAIAIENARLFQQSDFMSEMVHELRQPLAALKNSAALLLRPTLPTEKRGEIVLMIQAETDRLSRLTTDYLDLARLESGRTRLEMTAFPTDRLIRECIELVSPQAQERGITVQIEGEPQVVNADRGKIKQVLLNLLTNAIKYNRDNGEIWVRTRSSGRYGEPCAEVAVADTGFGIPREHFKNMFQKFHRLPDSSSTVQGTGLGLAIAKHIVEAHDGDIWLESEVGVGSTFFITLPLASQAVSIP